MISLLALAITTIAVLVVLVAAGRTRREVGPTLGALDSLRRDLRPALVVVRADRDRARRLHGR
jgi:hypothetical protein